MSNLKLAIRFLFLFLLPQLMHSQCIVPGTDMPCYGSQTYYHLNYTSPFGDTVVSTTWSLSLPLGDTIHSTKDTIIYLWTKSGTTDLTAKIITSGTDTFECKLRIQVKPAEVFEIYTKDERKCINGEIFNFCEGDSATFYTGNYPTYKYSWKLNDTLLSSAEYQTEFVHFPSEGLQKIIVTATDTVNGCIGSSILKTIKVWKAPVAQIGVLDLTIDSILICKNQKLRFENKTTPQSGNMYLWEIIHIDNDSTEYTFGTLEDTAFTYIFNHPGRHIVRLIAQNCFGCQTFVDFKVIVNSDRAVVIDCPSVVCQDSVKEVMYEAKDTCTTYTWTVIGSTHYRTDSNKIWVKWDSFPPNGMGYVKLHTSGCNGDVCDGETIAEVPILPTVGEITGQKAYCSSQGVNPFEVPMWPGASYQWSLIPDDDPDLTITSGEKTHRVFIKRDGYSGSFRIKVRVEHPLADCYFEKEDTIRTHNITLPNDTICFNTNATFQFDAHGESIDSASWTFITNRTYKQTIYNSDEVTFADTTTKQEGFKNLYLKVRFANNETCLDTARIKIERSISPPGISGPQIVCLDSSYIYSVTLPKGGSVEWSIINGTNQDSTDKSITVKWTVSGVKNKIVKARFHVGECYSEWSTIYITDIDSIDQIISGNPYPCEDMEDTYFVLPHPTHGKHKWILNPAFGQIILQNKDRAIIKWYMVPHDTTIILTYKDSLCGGVYEWNYPITIVKRFQGVITNSTACAGKDILFSVNVMAKDYLWDFGDGTFDTSNNITHKYVDRGFYRVNVRWTDAMGCVIGFSATKEIEVEPTLEPYIKAFNNINNEFIDCLTTDTVEIRFEANEYNVPDVKYRWFIDTIEQTDDTTSALIGLTPY